MRPSYGYFRRRPWERNDVRRQSYVNPLDGYWWSLVFYTPFIRFCLSHQMVVREDVEPGVIAGFNRRPIRDWTLRSTIDWRYGSPRSPTRTQPNPQRYHR